MSTKITAVSFISIVLFAAFAVFLITPASASARTTNAGPASLAFSIIDMVNQRLCERQISLGGRLRVPLVDPAKCSHTPPQEEPTVTLSANPSTIQSGQSSTLSWVSTNATSCIASNGWSGSKATSGSQSVSPTATTTYVITCTGSGGSASDDAVVVVTTIAQPLTPSVEITADPMTITSGNSSTLTWDSSNATTCTASSGWSGTKNVDGTQSVSPATTTTYAINCTGAGGSASDSVTITVNPATPGTPTVDITASRTSVTPGAGSATTTLSWTSTNTTTCEASNGWSGTKGTSGSETVTPSATTTYAITCTGAGGDANDSVTVNFVPAEQQSPTPTVTLTANPTSVQGGSAGNATTTLTWVSTDATSCTGFGAGFAGSKALNGSEVITPTTTTTYQIDCSGAGGLGSDDAVVTFTPAQQPSGNLLITEVHYDLATTSQGTESANEWVELHNGTNQTLNLAGYTISDAAGSDTLPEGTTLAAGQFMVITSTTTTASFYSIPGGAVVLVLPNNIGSNGLGNTGDRVEIRNAASSTVDAVSWGEDTFAFTPSVRPLGTADDFPGQSIGRIDINVDTGSASDWENKPTPTPGQ